MGMIPLKPDRDSEQQDYRQAVEGIREGYADFRAGRTRPLEDVFEELRVKYGLPR
jgi:hypothetical protein